MTAKKKMIEAFVDGETFVIKNRPVKWAKVDPEFPDTKYEPCWKVDIVLDEEWKDNLTKSGFNIHQDTDGDWVLRCKRKVKTMKGKTQTPPRVVGLDGRTPFTEAIGNGSICNIEVFAKYNEVAGKTHLTSYLNAIQVANHVPYGGGSSFDDLTGDDTPF